MNIRTTLLLAAICVGLAACKTKSPITSSTAQTTSSAESMNDADIEKILSGMSLEEKVGQMTQLNIDVISVGELYNLEKPHRLDKAKLEKAIVEKHVGSILNVGGHAYSLAHWQDFVGQIQDVATKKTRSKVPVIYGIDAIHGANYLTEGTLFPQPLAQAATFNPALVEMGAKVTAYETRATGVPWNFSPVLDMGRQPLWSRFFETYGEDVHLATEMGRAVIKGYQGEDASDPYRVASTMKHFYGYSAPLSGKDRTPVYIHERQLREYYLPTFEAAIEEGALSVMINSGELNGIAVHADKAILTDLLRTELGFDGVAVTDWEDIMKLEVHHRVAKDRKEAVKMAVLAGIDMSMTPNDYTFTDLLIELVKEGEVPISRINQSVRRVLLMKKRLGLFENPMTPRNTDYPDVGSDVHADLSYVTACESITLLKNENNILPLKAGSELIVTGPAADSRIMLNGAWSRTWQGVDPQYDDLDDLTITQALKKNFAKKVFYSEGCSLDEMKDVSQLKIRANRADAIVVCLGELPSSETPGNIVDLTISKAQIELVKAMHATGKPVIAVLVENRPQIISEIEGLCDAVLMAYQPGQEGGRAVADIISGVVNPSGKLPFTYPRYVNDLVTYDRKRAEDLHKDFSWNAFNPQWAFGAGLSYSEVKYSDLKLSADTLKKGGSLDVKFVIQNMSQRE
jgi:beta-glucosidase